jgi:methanobactin biosynthesis MbnP-like protein
MPRARHLVIVLLALGAIAGVGGWWRYQASQPIELTLVFHPFVGPEPLELNVSRYPNPGGEGRFEVRGFQFYLSNIRLTEATGGVYEEHDSYHLVRFDGDEPVFTIVLAGVPRRDYRQLEFGIGVDAEANRSLAQRGDLDPNGRMAWTWEVGYKFVLLEGTLTRGSESVPLVYHVGFDESYTLVSTKAGPARYDFRVDLLRLFQDVDMAALPTVKFDRADAARLARNFPGMITPMP